MKVQISATNCKRLFLFSLIMLITSPIVARAQSANIGGGTLTWTVSNDGGQCGPQNQYMVSDFGEFEFTYNSAHFPLSGNAYWYQDNGAPGCPEPGNVAVSLLLPSAVGLGSNCSIIFNPFSSTQASVGLGSSCQQYVQGYVDAKYVVLGVTYAPPGPNSFVMYSESQTVGTTTSIINTFTNSTTVTTSVSDTASIPGFKAGYQVSNAFTATEASKKTNTVTLNWSTSDTIKTFGTSDPGIPATNPLGFQPVDNDYDMVYVWLNPVLVFSASGSNLTWKGYGYDANDQNGMDVIGIALGYLNGDFGAMPPDILALTNRTWAKVLVGPSPALTTADFTQIATYDPFSNSAYGTNEIGYIPPNPNTADNRFSLTNCNSDNSVSYGQALPSQIPQVYTCTLNYSNLTTNAQALTLTASDTISLDESFTAGGVVAGFGDELSEDLKIADTLTYQYEADTSISNTQATSSTASITGLACNNKVADVGPCVPAYDAGDNEPVQFDIYQDNLYGTFMFAPVQYY